jgi:hypothetical protein
MQLAGALAAAIAIAVLLPQWRNKAAEPELSNKGGPSLRIVGRHEGKIFQVLDGDHLAPGDEMRFVVEGGSWPYLLIGSIDATGTASTYFPYAAEESGRLEGAQSVLPGSIVLDASRGPERVFALFSREPIQAKALKSALLMIGAGGPSRIRNDVKLPVEAAAQMSLLIEKDP